MTLKAPCLIVFVLTLFISLVAQLPSRQMQRKVDLARITRLERDIPPLMAEGDIPGLSMENWVVQT